VIGVLMAIAGSNPKPSASNDNGGSTMKIVVIGGTGLGLPQHAARPSQQQSKQR